MKTEIPLGHTIKKPSIMTKITEILNANRRSNSIATRIRIKNLTNRQKEFLKASAHGITGVSLGAATFLLMGLKAEEMNGSEDVIGNMENNTEGYDVDVCIANDVPFSSVVNDNMAFSEAFASARKDVGPGGFFEYKGETFNTYYKEEWDELSMEDKNLFFASIDENHIDIDNAEELATLNILNDDFNMVENHTMDHEDIIIDDDGPLYENGDIENLVIEDDIVIEDELIFDDYDDVVNMEDDIEDLDVDIVIDDFDDFES